MWDPYAWFQRGWEEWAWPQSSCCPPFLQPVLALPCDDVSQCTATGTDHRGTHLRILTLICPCTIRFNETQNIPMTPSLALPAMPSLYDGWSYRVASQAGFSLADYVTQKLLPRCFFQLGVLVEKF